MAFVRTDGVLLHRLHGRADAPALANSLGAGGPAGARLREGHYRSALRCPQRRRAHLIHRTARRAAALMRDFLQEVGYG